MAAKCPASCTLHTQQPCTMLCLLQVGGLLLVVPEHRLSLHLKQQELWLKGDAASRAVCAELEALAAMPYLDLLDESDELLHHRCGACLPAGMLACAHRSFPSQLPVGINAPHNMHRLPTSAACCCCCRRFKLVYACGSRQPMLARPERVSAVQALLHELTQLADAGHEACPELHAPGVAVLMPAASRCAGCCLC